MCTEPASHLPGGRRERQTRGMTFTGVFDNDDAFATIAMRAGRDDLTALGVQALPIDLSTTNPLPDIDAGEASYEAIATGGHPTEDDNVYARLWNPTMARLEEALSTLEGAGEGVTSSRCPPTAPARLGAPRSLDDVMRTRRGRRRGAGRHVPRRHGDAVQPRAPTG